MRILVLMIVLTACHIMVLQGIPTEATAGELAPQALLQSEIANLTVEIKSDPNHAMLYAKRGQCYARLKDWNKALVDTNKAIQLEPNNGHYYSARGGIYHGLQQDSLEKRDLEYAVKISPTAVPCLESLAALYAAEEKHKEACDLLSRAISIRPNSADLYLFRAETLIAMKDLKKAKIDLDLAVRLEPMNPLLTVVQHEMSAKQDILDQQNQKSQSNK